MPQGMRQRRHFDWQRGRQELRVQVQLRFRRTDLRCYHSTGAEHTCGHARNSRADAYDEGDDNSQSHGTHEANAKTGCDNNAHQNNTENNRQRDKHSYKASNSCYCTDAPSDEHVYHDYSHHDYGFDPLY
jgi:hypothetical protein